MESNRSCASSQVKKKEEETLKKKFGWQHTANKNIYLQNVKRERKKKEKKTRCRKKTPPPPPRRNREGAALTKSALKYTKAKQIVQYVQNWKGGKLYIIIYV